MVNQTIIIFTTIFYVFFVDLGFLEENPLISILIQGASLSRIEIILLGIKLLQIFKIELVKKFTWSLTSR